ncbi:MAG: HTTM domain-containing protein [Planctomycetota bacterium]
MREVTALETSTEQASVGRPDRLTPWWLGGAAPVHGLWRVFFYGTLFVWAFKDLKSPLSGLGFYAATDPALFRPYGLVAWLGIPYLDPELLRCIAWLTAAVWLAAMAGFCFRVTSVLTATGALFLHGMYHGSNGLNHYWFLPVYAMVAMCFAGANDRWSVDWHLRRWRGKKHRPMLADTGLARRLIMLFAVGFYFTAGVSKLKTSGLAWADGHTVHYFAVTRGDLYPLSAWLAENFWLCVPLAIGSLALEVGAPLALLSRRFAPWFLLGWAMMHAGIRLSMGPAYYANVLVLLVLVDWAMVARMAARPWVPMRSALRRWAERLEAARSGFGSVGAWRRGLASGLSGVLGAVLLAVALVGISWWPLTDVYMYSGYFSESKDVRAGYPRSAYDDAASVRGIAREFAEGRPNIEATEYFRYRVAVRLVAEDVKPSYLFDDLGVPAWKQWVLTITGPVAIETLAAPADVDAFAIDPRDASSASAFLASYVPVLKRHMEASVWSPFDWVELVYVLGANATEGPVALPAFWESCEVEIEPGLGDDVIVLGSASLR